MGITDYISNARTLIIDIPNAEIQSKFQSALFGVQGEALKLQEQVGRLQEENANLKDQLSKYIRMSEMHDMVYYARNAYWKKRDESNAAFCPSCLNGENKLMHLHLTEKTMGYCSRCKEVFQFVYDGPRPQEGDEATPKQNVASNSAITGPDYASRELPW